MKNIITRRAAAAAGVAGVAVMGVTSLGAGGAAAAPVPNTTITKTLVDGTPVTIQLFGQNANITQPLIPFPTTREVWVSGKVRVTVGGEAEGGTVSAGYIVGCQVSVGLGAEGGVTGGAEATPNTDGGVDVAPDGAGTAGASISLGPGEAGYVPIVQEADSDDDAVNSYTFTGNRGGVAYSQEKFGVTGCGGYAEAKAKIKVTVSTDSVKGVITLYGQPFSLG
ncbi:MspA family porin [Gordonia sp. Z-3]|jgi:hypothetical protein|uniref:MspA family porin n=1 Tax=Gordonia aquimaris TaxID=2984863 RepID=A0A9X3D0S7_9ACTN|nr:MULTISPECIES: MspA family porin [Gordonia]MCX2962733.1 MspA family porin [Gordonia aquimaris]MED5799877.1 MspA family porin [Gordonia sp. Z-3]